MPVIQSSAPAPTRKKAGRRKMAGASLWMTEALSGLKTTLRASLAPL
jgi:hypothetical protein